MLTRSKVAFVYVFIAQILNCATKDSDGLYSSHPSWSEHPWDLHPFLEDQYYKSVQLLKGYFKNEEYFKRTQRSLNYETLEISIESITPSHLSKNTSAPVSILNVNGERQILLEDNIFRVHEHENGNLFVEPEYILNILDPVLLTEARKAPKSFSIKIIFSKYNRNAEIRGTAEYNNDTVILMGYRNYSQVYILPHTAKGKWDKSKLKQTFSSESNKPKAAKFLQHNNLLYLVIVYKNKTVGKVHSIIYLWTGTHFDELFVFNTENASDLAVIEKNDFFLLIVSQNPHDGNVGSQLYKFIPQYGVFKIHAIHSHGSGKLLIYEDFDLSSTYTIFVNAHAKSNIYRLVNDEELMSSLATYDFQAVFTRKVAIIDGKSIIFLGTDNQIWIYVPEGESLRKIYNMNFHGVTKILCIDYIKIKNIDSNILLVVTKIKSSIDVQIVKFGLIRDSIVSETESDSPFQCLYDIEAILDERQAVLDDIASKVEKIMTKNGALVDGVLKVTQDVKLVNSKVDSIRITSDEELLVDTRTLIDTAGKVNDAITKLEEGVSHVILKEGPIEIKGTLEIKGDLTVENLSAVKLNVGTVNGKPFVGDAFLFNNETQHLRGESFVGKTINVKKLTSPLLNSFLSTASIFQSLKAENIVLVNRKTINDIELDSIVLKGYEGTIMGTKTFDRLTTYEADTERLGKELLTPWIQRSLNNEIPVKNLVVDNNLTVSHLFVKRINGINVTELMNSIYQRGIHTEIKGDITFLSNLNVTNLQTDLMENTKVEDFMTKTTEQIVTSTIKIDRLLSKTIHAKSINTLNINDDVAIIGRKNVVKSPTTVFDLDVARDLRLNCGSQNQSFCNIIPTKPEDLLQMYIGPVTIVGTLTVPELRFTKHARMKIDGIPFHTEIESLFWMTDKSQVITNDVTFSKGISVPQISAEMVNDQPVEKIYSTVNDRRNVSLLLKHVQVNNDVIVPENTQCSLIKEIDRTAVKKTGTYHITGRKTFTDTVTVDNLNTEYMNNLNMNEIVLKNNENTKFHGNMNFKTLRIKGDMIVNTNFDSYSINGFNLPNIYERAAKINEPAVLENVQFLNKINVENLQVRHGVLANIGNILQDTFKDIHVYVDGDVHVHSVDNVQFVNDVYFDDYMKKVVLKDRECEIRGIKHFKGDLAVEEDFYADVVNSFPFGKLFSEALTVSGSQEISGKHTIQNFIAPSINIESINGIQADDIVDVTSEDDLFIEGDVRFEQLSVTGDLVGELESPCDLIEAIKSYGTLPAKRWNKVIVRGDVNWDYGDGNITRMLEEAVLRDKDTVVESVVELEGLVTAQSVWSDKYINDIDVEYLMRDSLKKYSDVPQIIEGKKTINNNLYATYAAVTGLLESEIVNNFNVLEINRTLVRRNDDNIIKGAVIVEANIEIDSLFVPGKIHDVYVDDLVYDGDSRTIESARFETMEIASNLYVDYVNDVNLDEFLESTIKLNGPEQHIYEDVVFGGLKVDECKLDSINGMPFDNIVVDSVYDRVDVYGDKVFMQDIHIRGPAFVDILNSFDVRQMYQNTVFSDNDVVIDGQVIFKAPVAIEGNIEASETVNKVKLKETMNSGLQRIEETRKVADELIWHTQNNINNFLNEVNDLSVEFLYADVISDVKIATNEFKTTNIKSYRNQAILKFNTYNPGNVCNLKTFCLCPKHYTMHVFEDGSSSVFQETDVPMRVFDLLAPSGISIELITTTVSLSRECLSAAEANWDKSWIYWRSEDQLETFSTDLIQYISGFISDVKSFYSDGQYYAVVSQYYDFIMDSYNLDTVVLRLDIHKKQVTLIQRIPSYASWVLDITQTIRGIQLVVGNTFDSVKRSSDVESQILRFNPALVQFEFVQSIITSGCKSIVTVIIDESHIFLITLQNNYDPVIIWKYDERTNQYISYQTITFPAAVKSLEIAEVSNKNKHEPLLCVTTSDEKLHIYQHTFFEKWKIHTSGNIPGIQGVVHFSIATEHYILAMSQKRSKLLWLVAQGVF